MCGSFAYLANTTLGHPLAFAIVVLAAVMLPASKDQRGLTQLALQLCLWAAGFALALAMFADNHIGSIDARYGTGLPAPLLLAAGVISARVATRLYSTTIVTLAAAESLIGASQNLLGIRTFFDTPELTQHAFGEDGAWKNFAVYGLGPSPTNFAVRELLGITCLLSNRVILHRCGLRMPVTILLLLGLLLSASRTCVIAGSLGVGYLIWTDDYRARHLARLVLIAAVPSILLVSWSNWQSLGPLLYKENSVLSERESVFRAHIDFATQHPLSGNLGVKYFVAVGSDPDRLYSAHNSFLQVLSSCGVPFLVWLIYITTRVKWCRLKCVIPLVVASMGNVLIFNGASLVDQIFWATVLLSPSDPIQTFPSSRLLKKSRDSAHSEKSAGRSRANLPACEEDPRVGRRCGAA
jgi:hypothetical protein